MDVCWCVGLVQLQGRCGRFTCARNRILGLCQQRAKPWRGV